MTGCTAFRLIYLYTVQCALERGHVTKILMKLAQMCYYNSRKREWLSLWMRLIDADSSNCLFFHM